MEELKKAWNGESLVRINGEGLEVDVKIRLVPITKELPLCISASGKKNF